MKKLELFAIGFSAESLLEVLEDKGKSYPWEDCKGPASRLNTFFRDLSAKTFYEIDPASGEIYTFESTKKLNEYCSIFKDLSCGLIENFSQDSKEEISSLLKKVSNYCIMKAQPRHNF